MTDSTSPENVPQGSPRRFRPHRSCGVALCLFMLLSSGDCFAIGWGEVMKFFWTLAYSFIIATELPFVAIALSMAVVCRPRAWLAVPVLIYVIGLHIFYAREFSPGNPFILWNPWHFIRGLDARALVHLIASALLLCMTISIALAVYRWRRQKTSFAHRERWTIGLAISCILGAMFLASPDVLTFRYDVTVDDDPLDEPVQVSRWHRNGFELADGRCVWFQYDLADASTYVGDVVELVPVMGSNEGPDSTPVAAYAKVPATTIRGFEVAPLLTIPLVRRNVPRYAKVEIQPIGRVVPSNTLWAFDDKAYARVKAAMNSYKVGMPIESLVALIGSQGGRQANASPNDQFVFFDFDGFYVEARHGQKGDVHAARLIQDELAVTERKRRYSAAWSAWVRQHPVGEPTQGAANASPGEIGSDSSGPTKITCRPQFEREPIPDINLTDSQGNQVDANRIYLILNDGARKFRILWQKCAPKTPAPVQLFNATTYEFTLAPADDEGMSRVMAISEDGKEIFKAPAPGIGR